MPARPPIQLIESWLLFYFLPIVYLHGSSGELFKDQAWTVAFSLISSLLVAVLLIPVLYSKFYAKQKKAPKAVSVQFKRYKNILEKIIEKRYFISLTAIILIALAIFLVPVIGSEYFPKASASVSVLHLPI